MRGTLTSVNGGQEPVLRVERGTVTAEELAALVGALLAGRRGPVPAAGAPPRLTGRWGAPPPWRATSNAHG